MTEQNGRVLIVPLGTVGVWALWITALGLLTYATWVGSHMLAMWAMYGAAVAAALTVIHGQAKTRRMLAEAFRLGCMAAEREAREERGVAHLR